MAEVTAGPTIADMQIRTELESGYNMDLIISRRAEWRFARIWMEGMSGVGLLT